MQRGRRPPRSHVQGRPHKVADGLTDMEGVQPNGEMQERADHTDTIANPKLELPDGPIASRFVA